MTREHRYQPCYCEENIWWLCQHEQLAERRRWAAFICNEARQCWLREQRAVPAGETVVWDYHVILIVEASPVEVWDLDTRLGLPVPVVDYLDATFSTLPSAAAGPAPRFRLVEASLLLATLTSDRSHMRASTGEWLQPPPPWPAPTTAGHAMNVQRFIDMSDAFVGEIVDLEALYSRYV